MILWMGAYAVEVTVKKMRVYAVEANVKNMEVYAAETITSAEILNKNKWLINFVARKRVIFGSFCEAC